MFLNYYSKTRVITTGDEAALQRELQYNQGRIVTKTIEDQEISGSMYDKNFKTLIKMENKMQHTNILLFNTPIHAMHNFYHTVRIPKRTNGYRILNVPNDDLKEYQHIILKTLQDELKILPHNAAHGFTKKRNCHTSLEVHRKAHARWFLKMDIHNFFGSITKVYLEEMLYECANLYANSVTRNNTIMYITRYCTLNGTLPQGAPTSPFLANIAMVYVDKVITTFCKEHGLTYTRYADDLLISSPVKFDINTTILYIREVLRGAGLTLADEKTRFGSCNGRNWNLGLMYNKDQNITIGYRAKKLMKNKLHNMETKGYTKDERAQFVGLLSYYAGIEPDYIAPYLERAKALPYVLEDN